MPEEAIRISSQEIIFIFSAVLIFLSLLVTFFFVIIINYYRSNARRQSELLKAIVETQEKERNRIAIDMHDELGPLLSAVKLQVGALRNDPGSPLNNTLSETEDLLDEAIGQIRQIIRDLVPRNIDQKGLSGAFQDMKRYFETFTPLKINLDTDGITQRYNLQSEINVYRIIQEIVNNAVKHSQAEEVNISMKDSGNEIAIEVSDKGKGFDHELMYEGSGLKNIETRIKMNRGSYTVQAATGSGTHYYIHFDKKHLI